MSDQAKPDSLKTAEDISDFGPEFDEIEIGRLSETEYEADNLRHELFLACEREEIEVLEREFEEELSQLFSLSHLDEVVRKQPDPPGWLGL